MSKLKTLIKMELAIHVPAPVMELFFVLVVGYTIFSFGTATFNMTSQGDINTIDLRNIVNLFSLNLLKDSLKNVFFLNAIALTVLISMSAAGDLDSGFAETVLSYPVGRTEFILSKVVLFSAIPVTSIIIAILVGILLSPFIYPVWAILLVIIIVISKSFFITMLSFLSAILLKKTIHSAMILMFFWFILFLFCSLIPTPYKYVFFPEDVLILKDIWTEASLGLLGASMASIGMLLLTILYFRKLPITREQT